MIFTIDRLLEDGAYKYKINTNQSNIQDTLVSELFMPDHFDIQVKKGLDTAILYFNFNGAEGRIETLSNPFKLKTESDGNGVTKCKMGEAVIGNEYFEIKYCQTKGKGFFGGYSHYETEVEDVVYKFYDVNLGAKGRNFCVYKNDQLVSNVTFTYLGYPGVIYTVYSENDIDVKILSMLILFTDSVILRNNDGQSALFVASPKELKNKYDPAFVERIIQQDKTN